MNTTKSKVFKNPRQHPAELVGVYKEREFNDFVLWLSLPTLLKGRSADYLSKIGIEDEDVVRLIEIKNMTAFAEKYNLQLCTLSKWKKKARESGLLDKTRDFYRELTRNVFHAFYFETLKSADAARVRLWLEEFVDKAPEPPPMVTRNILTPQFNQVISQLRVEYKERLRKYYEDEIRKSGKV